MRNPRIVWTMAILVTCERNALASQTAPTDVDRPRNGLIELSLKDARSETFATRARRVGVISVVIKNISPAQLRIDLVYPELDFPVVVLDEADKPVPRTDHGRRIAEQLKHGIFGGSIKSRKLYPDDVYERELDLTQLFELKPGQTYKVRVETMIGPMKDHVENPVDRHLSRTMKLVMPPDEP